MNATYYEALSFCQTSTRENGIDYALNHNGTKLSALLVPPDVGQTYQIAAQAGRHPPKPPTYFIVLKHYRTTDHPLSQATQS